MSGQPKKILILGGVVGGIAVADRLRCLNEEFEITLVDRADNIGMNPAELPGYIAGSPGLENRLFPQNREALEKLYRLRFMAGFDAVRIDRHTKKLVIRNLKTGEKTSLSFDRLILSPGASPILPDVPGMNSPLVRTVRTLADAEETIGILSQKGGSELPVAVLGGSCIGLSLVEALRARGLSVVLVEAARQLLIAADREMVVSLQDALKENGIDLRLRISLSELRQESDDRIRLVLDGSEEIVAGFALIAVGVQPEVSLALDAGLDAGPTGGIKVNDRMQTVDPDIYAIGDVAETCIQRGGRTLACRGTRIGPAVRQARIAANHLVGFRHHRYESYGGSYVSKAFETVFASTGSGEKLLRRERISYEKVYVHRPNRHDLDAKPMTLKILFSPTDGRLYGAQAAGDGSVVRSIDVLATALRFDATVRQLGDLELCYAPPFGQPRNPVQEAGALATDYLLGLLQLASFKELKKPKPDQRLLDTRPVDVFRNGAIFNAISVPLDELRVRLEKLDPSKEYLVYCEDGSDSYLACRILSQNGFRAKYFSGGRKTYRDLLNTR